ncbi:MAG TPA: hypothetical protein ENN68_06325 [Methanomicrobia archaeon]|nr:hypothetical protein [Methanomicrobia archaeon]
MKNPRTALTGKKRIPVIFAFVLLAGLVIASFTLDFGLVRSESAANSQVSTFSVMNPQVDLSGTVYLYVEGNDPVSKALEAELTQDLRGIAAEVKLSAILHEQFDGPVIAVFMIREDPFYTPVYATATADMLYCFSSIGSTRYFIDFYRAEFGVPEPAVIFDSSDGPQLLEKGRVSVTISLRGLFSWPASKRYLAEPFSREIVTQLSSLP